MLDGWTGAGCWRFLLIFVGFSWLWSAWSDHDFKVCVVSCQTGVLKWIAPFDASLGRWWMFFSLLASAVAGFDFARF
jgi:hypothetical protein